WWGDLVTCSNAYDMWINEGWARFSEALFEEVIYGEQAYVDFVRDNHKDVLLNAHRNDGARYPVSGIPHEITYGDHVYNKGADVAHTLRGYMGDVDFFAAIQGFMEEYAYSDVSSETLRDYFSTFTEEDISSYFDNWIFDPGFPEFRVKSFSDAGADNWLVTIEQHSHYAPQLYSNVPMQLNAINANGEIVSAQIHATGFETATEMNLPTGFDPIAFYLNRNDAISMAVLGEERWINETGGDDFDFAEMDIDFNNLGGMDSVFVRIENHFAAVDENQNNPEYFISPDRWWNVITNANEEVYMDASIRYYGDQNATNHFDSLFFDYVEMNAMNEDSIILLYRPHGASAWEEFGSYSVSTAPGGNDNWTGRIDIDSLVQGQYAWAVRTGLTSVDHLASEENVRFNQTENFISLNTGIHHGEVKVFDLSGRTLLNEHCNQTWSAPTNAWTSGVYVVEVRLETGSIFRKKFLK
ncbi:MAG: M1 family aminopeptidase, partial [Flavobacteriales bacterium]